MQRGQEGQSVSVFTVLIVCALILIAGVATDGGAKIVATRQAQSTAADAARAASDAAASSRIAGLPADTVAARRAGENALARGGAQGSVTVTSEGSVMVTTQVRKPTIFLSILGLDEVIGIGSASSIITVAKR